MANVNNQYNPNPLYPPTATPLYPPNSAYPYPYNPQSSLNPSQPYPYNPQNSPNIGFPSNPPHASNIGYPANMTYGADSFYQPYGMQPKLDPAYSSNIPMGNPTSSYNDQANIGITEHGSFGGSFDTVAIRHAFIRKVYTILSVQLLFTTAIIALFIFQPSVNLFVKQNSWLMYLSWAVFLVVYIMLACCENMRRAMSYMTATISSFYETDVVMFAIGITAVICIVVTLFAMQTKYDLTKCSGCLCIFSIVLMIFGIVAVILATVTPLLRIIYSGLAALLFTLFLAFDTQMLIGGRKIELSPEEYILGALQLYVDIIYIFLNILQILGFSSKD